MRLRSARALALAVIAIATAGGCVSSDVVGTAEAPAGTLPREAKDPRPGPHTEAGSKGSRGETNRDADEAADVYGGLGTWIWR